MCQPSTKEGKQGNKGIFLNIIWQSIKERKIKKKNIGDTPQQNFPLQGYITISV